MVKSCSVVASAKPEAMRGRQLRAFSDRSRPLAEVRLPSAELTPMTRSCPSSAHFTARYPTFAALGTDPLLTFSKTSPKGKSWPQWGQSTGAITLCSCLAIEPRSQPDRLLKWAA
jgi:hypothetical protein